jgi:nucleotide-binding universal stress UspA family protein
MITFRKILFPVNLSARCWQSVSYIAAFARKFDSELTLLHVFDLHDPFAYGAMSSTAAYGAALSTVKEHHQAALAGFGEELFHGVAVKRVMITGEAADCIAKYAQEHAIDLIAMPTQGRSRIRRLLLGSTTAKLLHDTDLPILTTAHRDTILPKAFSDIRCIVCAVDLQAGSARLITLSRSLATAFGAEVQLVHAVPPVDSSHHVPNESTMQDFLLETATKQLQSRQEEAGTNFSNCVKIGSVPAVVRQAAIDYTADLVITDRGRVQAFMGPLRSNSYEIIRESTCPVLSVGGCLPVWR